MMQASIFVVDDQAAFRNALAKLLSRMQHRVRSFQSGEELLAAVEEEVPDLILLDLKMSGMSGIEVLQSLRPKGCDALVILLTAYGTVEDAVEAMKLGAFDFLIKTVDLDTLEPIVNRALEHILLKRRVSYYNEHEADQYRLNNLIAHSLAMRTLLIQVREVAQNPNVPILLMGETGTGKEFLARVIHHNSARAKGPFVKISCTTLSPMRFERDLFGYERGAFAGAERRKLGLLDQAETGTLFLDEIGDLDLVMQGKLVGIVQDRMFRRLGGVEDISGDFRVIASSYRDLKEEVSGGRFREDLFFRLNAIPFIVPPIRNRIEDIIPLAKLFMMKYGLEFRKEVTDIDPKAVTVLQQYGFPGNVRELQNIIERAMMLCAGTILTSSDLPGAH
ncbi:MAG: sigma-54-dependent Fis family transcriptional regulator [Nitrospira sp.]|nr:sigma-54-dependent Fis family transcriptional regulator [Nitrospira sp.]